MEFITGKHLDRRTFLRGNQNGLPHLAHRFGDGSHTAGDRTIQKAEVHHIQQV